MHFYSNGSGNEKVTAEFQILSSTHPYLQNFDFSKRRILVNVFILSQFSYCQLV